MKSICEAAGISRKTGYQWASKLNESCGDQQEDLHEQLARLRAEQEQLKKRCEDLSFENEGRKLAWEIHGVDEFVAGKKNTTVRQKRKKR